MKLPWFKSPKIAEPEAPSQAYPFCFSDEPTFKERVAQFWDWYSSVSQRFYQTIEDDKCPDLTDEVAENVQRLLSEFAWVFGPGPSHQGHSFTLSGEGNRHKQLLTRYWAECAPKLSGWTFYPARQPTGIDGYCMEVDGHQFGFAEFWLAPTIEEDRKRVRINVWHPYFGKLEDGKRWNLLFLVLDHLLGEYGVEQWIGTIDVSTDKPAGAIPIKELPALIAELQNREGWKKHPPGEEAGVYEIKNQHDAFPRGDVFVGSTTHLGLINDYMNANGQWNSPIAEYGADFAYLSIPGSWLLPGKEVEARGKIEDALDAALRDEKSGRWLGGAMGRRNAYIDLLLLDGKRSRDLVMRVAKEHDLPKEAALASFASRA